MIFPLFFSYFLYAGALLSAFFTIFKGIYSSLMDKNKTILIIDDSNSALILTECVFQMEGYRTKTAENVKDAIELISSEKPDLIVLDLMLPDISGYDFLQMRKELQIENIPVIIVSAIDSLESVTKIKEMGVTHFIPKPLNTELLLKTAAELLF